MKADSDHRTWDILLWQTIWRRQLARRLFYEMLGLLLMGRRDMRVLNCGYHEPVYPAFKLRPELEAERLGFQLYHRLIGSKTIEGADVIEVGCGRGGGARFLTEHFAPRSYWATDYSRLLIAANRFSRGPTGLRFRFARADRVPFGKASFDCGLTVETVHCVRNKASWLDEMARVMRPGGRLLIADFFYRRDSSPSALSGFIAAVRRSAWEVVEQLDWTVNALAALKTDSPRRVDELARLPRGIRKYANSFATTVDGPLYLQLSDGRAAYVHFALALRRDTPRWS